MHSNTAHWQDRADRIALDIACWKVETAVDGRDKDGEEIIKSVPLRHVRIQLANPADDRIPETLVEARLLAMGGKEIQVPSSSGPATTPVIDEATGFSGRSTVATKRTTVRNEVKAHREASPGDGRSQSGQCGRFRPGRL
jgi:hypothetical protein